MIACGGWVPPTPSPPDQQVVARINGLDYTQANLDQQLAFEQATYQLINDRKLELLDPNGLLQRLIPTLVLDAQAQQAGFTATEQEIATELKDYASGRNFQLADLDTKLQQHGYELADSREIMARAVRVEKYLDSVFSDPKMQGQDFSTWLTEQQTRANIEILYEPPTERPLLYNPAPSFVLTNLQGQPVSLAQHRGKPVILNFWATWCVPCRTEMPLLQTTLEQHRDDGLVVLAINFEEYAGLVEPFVSELDLGLEILYDNEATVSKAYQVTGLPTTFFINRQGIIQHIQIGQLDEDLLDRHLSSILKSP